MPVIELLTKFIPAHHLMVQDAPGTGCIFFAYPKFHTFAHAEMIKHLSANGWDYQPIRNFAAKHYAAFTLRRIVL